jgi:hypothetical protein
MGVLLGSTAGAADGRPVISGEPVVGNMLTTTPDFSDYQWQACDPSNPSVDCSDSPVPDDPNWSNLTDPTPPPAGLSYTVAPGDLGHFIRVVVCVPSNGCMSETSVPVGPVRAATVPIPPVTTQTTVPQHGVSMLVEPTAGIVLIKLPGERNFHPLAGLTRIPVGSVLDTRGGRVLVTAATGVLGEQTRDQSVEFYGGVFRLQQAAATNAPTVAKLVQRLKCPKTQGKTSTASGPLATTTRKRSRRVWGSGSGNYTTRGSGGTASVRGTTWLTKDTCKGTLFKVTEGVGITVRDFDRDRSVELGPGRKYFARNR